MTIENEKNGGGEYQIIDGGVRIISRYSQPRETALMYRVLRSLPTDLHGIVDAIFCDSKHGAIYTVEVNSADKKKAEALADWMSYRFVLFAGGHGDIRIQTDMQDADTEVFKLPPWYNAYLHEEFAERDAERLASLGQTAWTTQWRPTQLERDEALADAVLSALAK